MESGGSTSLRGRYEEKGGGQQVGSLFAEATDNEKIKAIYGNYNLWSWLRYWFLDTENYDTTLRAALRQSPDVILLGEMRDYETMRTAMTAAETGHLLLSSLHTNGVSKAVDRIIDVFPPNQQPQIRTQLSMVLEAVVSQQLVPSVDGGQIPAFEVMRVNPAIRNMIRSGKVKQIDAEIYAGQKQGMISMETSLQRLLAAGRITPETARLYSDNYSMG